MGAKKKKEQIRGMVSEASEAGFSPSVVIAEGAFSPSPSPAGFVLDGDFPGYCPMNEATYAKYLGVRIANLQVSLDELKESFRSTFGEAGVSPGRD